jgi:hypothetical protein
MYEYGQLDMQSLIDLLAEETEKYTKACVANIPAEAANHKYILDDLVKEINMRKAKSRRIA